ncbi:camphor resistance protein CrcB [Labedella gwakjiensis]|uniref:Fluoride-specific ion channel FluC n=1 Tax=Labedella gwakjiensis TaxID=390269 RepID=A0A2P8GSJ3_9MICO|nr:fluoride efflux transporter CrcB [Labedella gwakjiensis]PSL36931.1 camphor resistance protein CrcB [Labedella gwakjiensis]RUQ81762.1 fluoride efflux transporter CrcB [Labedella gwakjiensis]
MIEPWLFVAICVAGGLGAALRYSVDAAITPRLGGSFPLATAVINVSGSFGLGLLVGAAASAGIPAEWLLVGGGGLMGGYTTFSTASLEAVRLAQKGRYLPAIAYVLGVVVLAVASASLGIAVGSAL